MHEFCRVLADEGRADDNPTVLVDDQLGSSGVSLGVQAGATDVAEVVFDRTDIETLGARLRSVRPTAATSGSVNTARGTAPGGDEHLVGSDLVTVVECHRHDAVRHAVDTGRCRADAHVHPLTLQRPGNVLTGERLLTFQQPRDRQDGDL